MEESQVRLRGADPLTVFHLTDLLGKELAQHRLDLESEWDRLEAARRLEGPAGTHAAADAPRTAEPAPGRSGPPSLFD